MTYKENDFSYADQETRFEEGDPSTGSPEYTVKETYFNIVNPEITTIDRDAFLEWFKVNYDEPLVGEVSISQIGRLVDLQQVYDQGEVTEDYYNPEE